MTIKKRKPGQPRKAPGEKRVTISASVSPETAAALRREAELSGQSIGKQLDHIAGLYFSEVAK